MGDYIERTKGKAHLLNAFTGKPVVRWQIRIRSDHPVLIDFTTEPIHDSVRPDTECYKLVRRTSYMQEGPNRKVWWAIDKWNVDSNEWECQVNGVSTLKAGAGPE